MSITVAEVLQLKRAAEIEIARVLDEFQQQTGLAVSGVSHCVAEGFTQPPKILRATLHVELRST